ncbi:MAG: hypothetical protein ACYC0P_03095 [Thiobacillus sp.]
MSRDLAHDTLDLGYDELHLHGCSIEAALAVSDCRIEVALAYLHAIAVETGEAGPVRDGIWRVAQTLALLDARACSA